MNCVYPKMEEKIATRGIKKKVMASRLGISQRCFYNKLKGITPFTYQEVEDMQKIFFPDMTKEQIMYKEGECDKYAS